MNERSFLERWELEVHPFRDEEAKNDTVFERLIDRYDVHPQFSKVYGDPRSPGPAVVFGAMGSGKTALKRQIMHRIAAHNEKSDSDRVWVVAYDELNPFLRSLEGRSRGWFGQKDPLKAVDRADHMDAILSLAVTGLVSRIIDRADRQAAAAARKLPVPDRETLGVLALIYDQKSGGNPEERYWSLWRAIRPRLVSAFAVAKWLGIVFACAALVGAIWLRIQPDERITLPVYILGGAAAVLLGFAGVAWARAWGAARRIATGVRVLERPRGLVRSGLARLKAGSLEGLKLPEDRGEVSRYDLRERLTTILRAFGYSSLLVLVDRVDEPTLVQNRLEAMWSLVAPMFNNHFLQQERTSLKLLLPIEINHEIERADRKVHVEARLDKQNTVLLDWDGRTLYELCTERLRACKRADAKQKEIELADLFSGIDAAELKIHLGQLVHPRRTLKFLYSVIQGHPDTPDFKVSADRFKLLLEAEVRDIQRDARQGRPV